MTLQLREAILESVTVMNMLNLEMSNPSLTLTLSDSQYYVRKLIQNYTFNHSLFDLKVVNLKTSV